MQKVEDRQHTKIVTTIGPASSSYETLDALVKAGVDILRLNFSHGTHEEHSQVIEHIQKINETRNTHVGILADLQGPKLRVGTIQNEPLVLEADDEIVFVNEQSSAEKDTIFMNYEQFPKDVEKGERVLIDDGKIVLEVLETDRKSKVRLKVLYGGKLSSKKGVNLPETNISQPSLTEKDLRDLDFILGEKVQWIALSFIRKSSDIAELKKKIKARGHQAKTIAKIEKPEAVKNIDEIIDETDAIMIARGDLGVEVPIEELPGIQKTIIEKCIQHARPVIVATQMMESMIVNPSPTRAEVTDVANAVHDGADALMLSAETSVGKHPVRVVTAMNKIILEAESHFDFSGRRPQIHPESETFYSDVINFGSARIARGVNASAIIGMTMSGYTAFKISSFRLKVPIYIFSENREILNTLSLVWGVRCYYYGKFTSTDQTHTDVINILKEKGKLKPGDVVINTGSMPIHKRLRTNMLKLSVVD